MSFRFFQLLLLLLTCSLLACSQHHPSSKNVTVKPITLTGQVPAHSGPRVSQTFQLLDSYPQRLWVTGFKLELLPVEGLSPEQVRSCLSGAYLNFDDIDRHTQLLQIEGRVERGLFALDPGILEVELPPGFGIPLHSNEQLRLVVQWQNPDPYLPATEFACKATVKFGYEWNQLRSVTVNEVHGLAVVEGKGRHFGVAEPKQVHGRGCVSSRPRRDTTLGVDPLGDSYSTRWWVPTGLQNNDTFLNSQLSLPSTIIAAVPHGYPGLRKLNLVSENGSIFTATKQENRWVPSQLVQPVVVPQLHYRLLSTFENESPVETVGTAALYLYTVGSASQ